MIPRHARWAGALLLGALAATALGAQDTRRLRLDGPGSSPLRQANPTFVVTPEGFAATDLPLRVVLQAAYGPDFSAPLYADTTLTISAATTVAIPRLVAPNRTLYWRASAITTTGVVVTSTTGGPVLTSPWLTLRYPNNPNGNTIALRRPAFQWSVPRPAPPLAGWQFEVRVLTAPSGAPVAVGRTDDTTYTPVVELETNTSYRWQVKAWIPGLADTVTVASAATFVVLDPAEPVATVLYQNFPNPFPNARTDRTCIWFDLKRRDRVELAVVDLRGNLVRRLVPSAGFAADVFPGRWGRPFDGSTSGCDPRFEWDGTDETGRVVPAGVYFIRLKADGTTQLRKALFKGR